MKKKPANTKTPASEIEERATRMLGDIEVEERLYSAVMIDPQEMDEEFCRVSSDFAYFNEKYANAIEKHLAAKADRERVYAVLFMEARVDLVEDDVDSKGRAKKKHPSVDLIKATIEADDTYTSACADELLWEAERMRLRGRCEAISMKKDALQSLGANKRIELMNDPVMRKRMAELKESA